LLITLPAPNLAAAGRKSALTRLGRPRLTVADVRRVVDQVEWTSEASDIPATRSQ
jgi:hypothetical protein